MSSSTTDPQDVIGILCAVASEQDVGNALTRVIQKSFGQEHSASSVKQLVADLVHVGSIHDSDWEFIVQSIKGRLASADPDSQIFALSLIPSIPVRYLVELMIKDGLGNFIVTCLQDANPTLRSSSISAFGHLLTQSSIIDAFAENPSLAESCLEHWQSICDGLVDPDNQVSGSAFNALKLMMEGYHLNFRTQISSPSAVLVSQWLNYCLQSIEKYLAAVINRAQELDPDGLVAAIEVLSFVATDQLTGPNPSTGYSDSPVLWTVAAIGQFLERQLSSVDSTVVSKSAHVLLELCERVQDSAGRSLGLTASNSLPNLSLKAITCLENLWESKESVPARAQIASTICKFLNQVDLTETGEVAVRMLQKISLLPNPSDRIQALMELWKNALAADLKLRRLRHSRGDVASNASLQSIIESAFFAGVVAGHMKSQMDINLSRSIQKASYPAYKQELVSSLMKVLMDHSRRFKIESVFPPEAHEESKEVVVTMESAINTDVQIDVIDWFAASVVALYLTQACLGWDNAVTESFYGLTLPSDLWLQQLQLTSQTLYSILDHFKINSFSQLRTLDEDKSKTKTGKILKTLAGEAFEIQKLMKRMVFFWSFLNDALKPRVFWIVCHHIELPDRVEDIWNHLRDCLKDLMIIRPTELIKRQQKERINAAKDGLLAPVQDTVYFQKTTTDPKTPAIAVDQSEVALEGITVGLLCFGILTESLMSQYTFISFACYYDRVRGIALLLKEVCNQLLEEDFLTVDMFDQCQSILKQLEYVIDHKPEGYDLVQSSDPQEGSKSAATAADNDQSITFLPADLSTKHHEGYPFSNSKSLAYIITKRSRRYKALHKNLHLPKEASLGSSSGVRSEISPPVPAKPTSVDLATAVGGLDLKEEDSGWKILTGQGDPVQLSLRHEVDAFRRVLTLEIHAENKIGSDITGVVVSFAIEGSVSTYREGMIVWQPERLQAQDPVRHEVQLGLIEFGSIEIQPFMEISLQSTEEDFPALSCLAYSIPLLDLLIPVDVQISPKVYFQEMCSWPDSVNITAVCRWPGTNGGMQLLSALNKTKLQKIWPRTRNSLSFFQAIYLAQTFTEAMVSLTITGQLVDLRQMGLAMWALGPEDEDLRGNVGYYLCKCTFASTSPRAIMEIRSKAAELLSDLTEGGLIPGLDPGVGRPPAPPPIHPAVYVDLTGSENTNFQTDLQSLAVQEWKRLNQYQ